MDLLVVIVNYRVAHLTIDCLHSLTSEINTGPSVRVAICENGTGDDSADRIQQAIDDNGWRDWAELTAIHPNRGFTGGNNVILRAALDTPNPPRYFLLLNADTIVHPGALRTLVEFMDAHPRAGMAGSRLEFPDGRPQCSAFRFFTVLNQFESALRFGPVSRRLVHSSVARPIPDAICQTDWVSGAALMVRRAVLEQIGLLDEELFTYFDDVDLCLRAARAGWQTWYVPTARIVHLEGQTTGVRSADARPKRRPKYWLQARRQFTLKRYGPTKAVLMDAARIIGLCLRHVIRLLRGQPDVDPPHLLSDTIRHSVFLTGFGSRPVENPALLEAAKPVSKLVTSPR